jgi:TRAP-type mannitol/chloroaromatic compound transport system permease large subunit
MILMLVTASNLFGAVFSRLGSAEYLASLLTSLALPPTLMLIVILGLIFVLGWPLEWVPIVLIVVPIVLPIVQAAGIDMIWFCTLVAMTLQTAWLSPPVALSAYFLKGVGAAMGTQGHLCRHVAVHGPADRRGRAGDGIPATGDLAGDALNGALQA